MPRTHIPLRPNLGVLQYDASCLDDSKIHMNVRDTEDILEDATKSQIKMKNKMKDPVAIQKKQNVCTIYYNKLNALYDDFVSQKELSDEQKYFPPSFISSEDSSNKNSPYSSSEKKSTNKSMPSENPILVDLNQMENDFQKLFELLETTSKRENNDMHDEIEKVQKDSIEIQEGMQKHINSLENDVQRCQKQSLDFELQLQHEKEKRKCEWKSLRTRTQTQGKIDELIEHINQKTHDYATVRAQNQDLLIKLSELKANLKHVEK
ncbi:hypothetical protein Tco_1299421, partial [Tanacetum coccineum]